MSIAERAVEEVSFLLRFDLGRRVTTVERFDDPVAAENAYDRAERALTDDDDIVDIVLVSAVDLDTVRVTHASYFTGQRVEFVG